MYSISGYKGLFKKFLSLFCCIFLVSTGVVAESVLIEVSDVNDSTLKYLAIDKEGNIIEGRLVGPGLPPVGYDEKSNLADLNDVSAQYLDMFEVPAMSWSYGCTPTSATMLFGYLDRNGYPNMYTGPTNGGIFPLTNEVWGPSFEGNGQCPLTASQNGLDGRTTKGHKDDYYYSYGSSVDPYFGAWDEHTPQDCIADYMGTSMFQKYGLTDGGTWIWMNIDGSPLYDFTEIDDTYRDGMHKMKLFAESRGYSVATDGQNSLNYNQLIYGYEGNTKGFTYDQYKAEIDAGYPVLIQVEGHTMLGVGYAGIDQIIIHNTWDYYKHTMTWGGSYQGMQHYGVGVIHLDPPPAPTPTPTVTPTITPTVTPTITPTPPEHFSFDVQSDPIGWINPSGKFTVPSGESKTFMIKPAAGAMVKNLTINGDELSPKPESSFTIDNVDRNYIIRLNNEALPGVVIAAFSINSLGGNTVRFTDASWGSPTIWKWDFGDRQYGEGSQVEHKYEKPGVYTVSMWARNDLSQSQVVAGNIEIPLTINQESVLLFT